MSLDIDRLRAETPGCDHVTHLNNAGAALPPTAVTEAQIEHLRLEASIGGYEAHDRSAAKVDRAYDAIAKMLNCQPSEVAIVENATRAWDMAFYSIPFEPGDRILTGKSEYASNYVAFLQMAKRKQVTIEVVPDDQFGQLDVAALEESVSDSAKGPVGLIAVSHVPTNGGLVNPAAAIGRIAEEHDIPFLLDACQSAGQMPLDVQTLHCTMLSATGRKFLRGPRGIGFLYVRDDWVKRLEPAFIDLHAAKWTGPDTYELRADAKRFENWEINIAAKIGLGVAVDYALDLGLDIIRRRVAGLAAGLRSRIDAKPGFVVLDKGLAKAGIVTFLKVGEEPSDTKARLAKAGVNVTTTGRAWTLLDMDDREIETMVRASPHYYNTEEELDRLAETI
ncbi:MAG: aminotransferase class V-fold PLP-dependent enzyme [Pseudomonadota bacterium]